MATPEQKPGNAQGTRDGGNEQRSESLLPADGAGDGRYDVAEEVNTDQQSDAARRIGKPPKGIGSDALADSLVDKDAGGKAGA